MGEGTSDSDLLPRDECIVDGLDDGSGESGREGSRSALMTSSSGATTARDEEVSSTRKQGKYGRVRSAGVDEYTVWRDGDERGLR